MPELASQDTATLPPISFAGLDSLSYALGRPQGTALFKQEFEDFCVEEELGFPLSGNGEHLCLQVKKTDLSTTDVARRLSESTGTGLSAIGYAGMKDRRGQCTQWFSVQLAEAQAGKVHGIEDDHLQILQSDRNSRKLKIGSHKANRFRILLRQCSGERSDYQQRLQQLTQTGVPNYFGSQRFGRHMSNMIQVQELMENALAGDSTGASSRLSSSKPSSSKHPSSPKGIGRHKRGMLFSAARAYLFNQLLSTRLADQSWSRYLPGDVLNLDGTSRCFVLSDDSAWDAQLQQRLDSFDIHITGPLCGEIDAKDKYVSRGQAADIEDGVAEQFGTLVAGLHRFGLKAARRPLRFMPADLEWHWPGQTDLALSFSLSSGSYATSLLRELCDTKQEQ